MTKGLYIAFEGVEGSGKSTHLKFAAEHLKSLNADVVCTVEPGATELGKKLRELVLHHEMDPLTELFLYSADRREHIKQVVLPALSSGKVVLSDRCFLSTIAYQGYGRGIELSLIEKLCETSTDGIKPHLIIVFDLDIEEALKRCGITDRIERESVEFHERVRKGYLKEAQKRSNIVVIDSSQPKEKVKEEVARLISSLMKGGAL